MMALSKGQVDTTYIVSSVETVFDDLREFLFSLGVYPGEEVTIISKLSKSVIINIKDARYNIDKELADVILCD